MSRRKQQRPLHIVDEDTQEAEFNEKGVVGFSEEILDVSNSEAKSENVLEEIDAFNFCIKPETNAINLNGTSQESFSDSELDRASMRTCIRSEHDLYEFFTHPSKKRRKYIRGGDKVCMVCGKVTKSPSDLERHVRVHTGERPFQCVICYKPFKCKRSQQSHQYICHDLADGLSESRIALLDIHKKHRTDMFTKLKNELSKDKIELYDDSINATILQNSISELEELLNSKDYQNNNSNCLVMHSDCLKHSNAVHSVIDKDIISFSKQCDSNGVFQPLDKETIPLQSVCVWNNNESEILSTSEKEPGEKSYLCELCGQDFSSLVHFNSHHQTVHENDLNIQNNFFKSHSNHFSFKLTQVNAGKISSLLDNRSSQHEIQTFDDAELVEKKQNVSDDLDKEDSKCFDAKKCQEIKFNGQMDLHSNEKDISLSNSLEPTIQYSGLCRSSLIGTPPVAPNTYLLTSSSTNNNDCSLSWHNIKIHSEKVLITRLEGVHSTTEQNYILYKCCLCGSSYPGLSILCSHLAAHSQYNKEHNCEKCGAVFKWRSQLEVHEQVHRVIEDKLSLLPNYVFSSPVSDAESLSNQFLFQTPLTSLPTSQHLTSSQISNTAACNPSPLSSPLLRMMLQPTNSEDNNKMFSPNINAAIDRLTEAKKVNNKNSDPLQCKYCPKTFDRIFSLQRHERIHTGIKPCCCKICGRGFSERRNLRHHMIRFHSDSNQRDLFRRSRRSCYQRNNNSSLRLISFLKRTAVRILNSIDQTRFDSSVPIMSSNGLGTNYNEIDEHETSLNEHAESNSKPLKEMSDNENITVVIPIDVSDGSNKSEDCLQLNHRPVLENKELLKDPKQSLIGSRKKGRPYKFNPMHGSVDSVETKLLSQKSFNEQQENFLFSPSDVDYLFQELNILNFDGEGTFSAGNDQFSDPDKLSDKMQESLPTKLHGPGTFFSNYNPSYCRKTFCSTSDLNRHMNFHEDVRPYKCSYCNYYSRTNSQLKVHTMRHQGIKQFLCQTCNYNGVTQSDLNRHCKTRTHLLRARNICLWCKLGFYTPMLLDEHIRSYHQTEIVVTENIMPFVTQEVEGSHQTADTNLQQPLKDSATAPSADDKLLPQTNTLITKQMDIFENNNYVLNGENETGETNQIVSSVGGTKENIP